MARKPLDAIAIADFLAAFPHWKRDGGALVREHHASSARAALRAIRRIGDLAEGADHHPELLWVYDRLTIRLTTHDVGNAITSRDTHLARCVEDVLNDAAAEGDA
ncbi:MAG: 4a-hydroxytetrahydrobiopterin dehydratase [Myxococcota bacterium]|jgi:4a-hydroxytetrahydrobiopterin dehydratase|nr:4a-hydroxytetrahydrobiopterin dehydratase [Myxococcota bacterium]